MRKSILWEILTAGAILLTGCRSEEDFSRLAEEVPPLASEKVRSKRLADFRRAWENLPVRAVQTNYQTLSPYAKINPKRWLFTLTAMGCNRLVITIRPETDLAWPCLRAIAEEAAGKMQLFFELEQKDYLQPYRGNRLIRSFTAERQTLKDKCRQIAEFNRRLPDRAKIAGIILTAQPDHFTDYNINDRPKELLFSWAADRYGKGGSNDTIMRYTMQSFRECIRDSSRQIPFVIGMPDFTHDAVMQKQLSTGSVQDFIQLGTHPEKEVILHLLVRIRSGKNSRADVDGVNRELADGAGKMIVGVDMARHPAVVDGTLPRQSWNGMCRIMKFCIRKWRKSPHFHGLVIGPWSNVQTMLEEL